MPYDQCWPVSTLWCTLDSVLAYTHTLHLWIRRRSGQSGCSCALYPLWCVCVCVHSLARLPLYVRRKGVPNERTNERTNKHTFTHNTTYKRTSPNKWRGRHSHALILFSFSFVVQYSMLLADRVRPIGRTIDRCSIHVFSLHRRAHFRLLHFVRSFFLVLVYLLPPNGQERTRARPPNCAQLYKWLCVSPGRNDSGQIYWQMPTAKWRGRPAHFGSCLFVRLPVTGSTRRRFESTSPFAHKNESPHKKGRETVGSRRCTGCLL